MVATDTCGHSRSDVTFKGGMGSSRNVFILLMWASLFHPGPDKDSSCPMRRWPSMNPFRSPHMHDSACWWSCLSKTSEILYSFSLLTIIPSWDHVKSRGLASPHNGFEPIAGFNLVLWFRTFARDAFFHLALLDSVRSLLYYPY